MAKTPKKVAERLAKSLGQFQRVLAEAQARDVNESDTVTIVTDMLSELFGYDKYADVTSEQAIRGTYCDLAVRIDSDIKFLIEVKAIGLTLKENHLRQAVNYGANQGIPWVVLTNGAIWDIHRIKFEQPISHELVCSFDLRSLSPRKRSDHDLLYILCKEGLSKDAIESFHQHVRVVNRFTLAALIQSDSVLAVLRRELRRMSPELTITTDEIGDILPDVLKRDVLEGDSASRARRRVKKASDTPLRKPRRSKPKAVVGEER